MGKRSPVSGLLIIFSICVLCGCSGPSPTPAPNGTYTFQPSIGPAGAPATVNVSGNEITIAGDGPQTSPAFSLERGAYEVSWSGFGSTADDNVVMELTDSAGSPVLKVDSSQLMGRLLLPVDARNVRPGPARLKVTNGRMWLMTLSRPDLTQISVNTTIFIGFNNSTMTSPWLANGSQVTVKTEFQDKPAFPAYLQIVDVLAGGVVFDRQFIPDQNGEFNVTLPKPGVYLSAVVFPSDIGGRITLAAG